MSNPQTTPVTFEYTPSSPWVKRISRFPFPIGTTIFLLTSRIARIVFKRVVIDKSTDEALHPIYEYSINDDSYSVWDHRWQSSKSAQSLRFRFSWISRSLYHLMHLKLNSHEPTNVISLGSGTGLAFINTLKEFEKINPNHQIKVSFVDIDPRAIERAIQITKDQGLESHVSHIHKLSSEELEFNGENHFDLVEMVGIAEYVDDEWLLAETKRIYRALKPGGYYVGAAISDNSDAAFAHKVLHWPKMVYRSRESLNRLLKEAGFTKITFNSLGIFEGWIAQK